ncbi:hypothetical protein ACFFWA_15600 [Actinomadura verrucosospora]|uniref:hypothetical protein n=1 Tax=Actinomadura verrucosospora TaxID=46165 RepID=UPI0035ECA2E9
MKIPAPGIGRRTAVARALAELEGSRRAVTVAEWLDSLDQDEELAYARADRRRNVLAVLGALARAAEWPDMPGRPRGEEMTSRPGWAWLAAEADVSRSTVAAVLTWARRRGRLAVVETGTTPTIRAGKLYPLPDPHADQGNRAAVYVLAVPIPLPDQPDPTDAEQPAAALRTKLGPLPASVGAGISSPARAGTRAREEQGETRQNINEAGGLWKTSPVPGSRSIRLAVAAAMRATDRTLSRLSARHLRHIFRPWWDAGWTPSDILYAVNHQASGEPWPYAYAPGDLRHVAGWLRHRLAHWLDPNGAPGPSRSQALAAARRAEADQQARRTAAAAAARAAAAPAEAPVPAAQISAVRAELLARLAARGRLAGVQQARRRAAQARKPAAPTRPKTTGTAPAVRQGLGVMLPGPACLPPHQPSTEPQHPAAVPEASELTVADLRELQQAADNAAAMAGWAAGTAAPHRPDQQTAPTPTPPPAAQVLGRTRSRQVNAARDRATGPAPFGPLAAEIIRQPGRARP